MDLPAMMLEPKRSSSGRCAIRARDYEATEFTADYTDFTDGSVVPIIGKIALQIFQTLEKTGSRKLHSRSVIHYVLQKCNYYGLSKLIIGLHKPTERFGFNAEIIVSKFIR